jgi:hypothetical protein
VNAEDSLVDERSQRKAVENFCAMAPHVDRSILAQALVVKAVHLSDLPTLVVASNQSDLVRVAHLECQQEQKGLHGVEATIDEVSHEKVVRAWTLPSYLEQFHQVVELAVNVSADLHKPTNSQTSITWQSAHLP